MKTATGIQGLEAQIKRLVQSHMAAVQAAATAAVVRAFAASPARSSAPKGPSANSPARRAPSRRRGAEEVAELTERFCAAVHAAPGASMTTLAAQLAATPRELAVPVKRLRNAGRVRTVGERQYTKYFPCAPA